MLTVKIEKLVFGGQGLARTPEGQIVFVWNALPGEEVDVEILKRKKNLFESVAVNIHNPSPDRVAPVENHWLSSSPWQMMNFAAENNWKKNIAAENYNRLGGMSLKPNDLRIVADKNAQTGYRNKMEFSFTQLADGKISLAFFERGKKIKIPALGSILAEPEINEMAQNILNWINEVKIPIRSLKTIILRGDGQSLKKLPNEKIKVIAALFLKDEMVFENYPELNETMVGFHIFYSTHKCPASVPTKLMYSNGQDHLIAELMNTKLKFGLLSFFQINPPIFNKALEDIVTFFNPKMPIIDFYSGVGSIGLPLSADGKKCHMVDNNPEAIQYAKDNIILNNRQNCEATCIPAENMTELIEKDKIIILDPPRAGLHQNVVEALLQKTPRKIIYLSCDMATHARDIKLLSDKYSVKFLKLYNFFPRTPHIEGLCVLDKIL